LTNPVGAARARSWESRRDHVRKAADQIRIETSWSDLDELEKAVTPVIELGDFKNNIRNHLLTQKVGTRTLGSHISIGASDGGNTYDEHKAGFVRPGR